MRDYMVSKLKTLAVTSTSLVLSRPALLAVGADVEEFKLTERLRHLGYQRSTSSPSYPGEYLLGPSRMDIFLKGFSTSVSSEKSGVITLHLNKTKVEQISRNGKAVSSVLLEPEALSLLGASSTRMSLPKSLSVFPDNLKHAVLAIEDERFYSHFGIDPIGVARAMAVNFKSGRMVQGGSTLTQQLAKNILLTNERNLSRKILEAVCAVLLETAFTKDQILEFYFNEVFLGQEGNVAIHGFGEAARSFFNKDVEDLTLEEAATLAGVVKAPTTYNPRRKPENAKERRLLVLQKMREQEYITPAQEAKAKEVELTISPPFHSRRESPFFVDYVRKVVEENVTIPIDSQDSLRIYTSLDRQYQQCAESAVQNGLGELENKFPRLRKKKISRPLQSALVSVIPASGEIVAWVGGRDYQQNQFDRVSMAKRQPGSAFKPFVYLTALDGSLNSYKVARTTSILDDQPVTIENPGSTPWTPSNYEGDFRGEVTLRDALVHSLNIPTVNLVQKVGIDAVKNTAALFGFGDLPAVPSIALGAGEVTPLELARAYSALAEGGLASHFHPVFDVTVNGRALLKLSTSTPQERIASEPAVFVLTTIMQDVVNHGTATAIRQLGYKGTVAGKTGTTNDARDAWFAGFTPHLLTVVWVGFDDNSELGLTGGKAAAPIWANYMKCVEPLEPVLDFIPPPGVKHVIIDKPTGLLASDYCPKSDQVGEWFVEGTEPETECNRLSDDGTYTPEQNESSLVEPSTVAPVDEGLPAADKGDGLFD